jgi:hypothetical protein
MLQSKVGYEWVYWWISLANALTFGLWSINQSNTRECVYISQMWEKQFVTGHIITGAWVKDPRSKWRRLCNKGNMITILKIKIR